VYADDSETRGVFVYVHVADPRIAIQSRFAIALLSRVLLYFTRANDVDEFYVGYISAPRLASARELRASSLNKCRLGEPAPR